MSSAGAAAVDEYTAVLTRMQALKVDGTARQLQACGRELFEAKRALDDSTCAHFNSRRETKNQEIGSMRQLLEEPVRRSRIVANGRRRSPTKARETKMTHSESKRGSIQKEPRKQHGRDREMEAASKSGMSSSVPSPKGRSQSSVGRLETGGSPELLRMGGYAEEPALSSTLTREQVRSFLRYQQPRMACPAGYGDTYQPIKTGGPAGARA